MSDTTADNSASDEAKIGTSWGDDISQVRKAELDAIVAAWEAETDHGDRKGPFDTNSGSSYGVRLSAADVCGSSPCRDQ